MLKRAAVLPLLVGLWGCGNDYQPPPPVPQLTITCPAAVEAQSTTGAAVSVAFTSPTSSGGQAPVNLSCTPPSGSLFPGGTTNVTCTATDSRGLSAACTLPVFVRIPPRLIGTGQIVAFGDSITAGTPGGGTLSPYSVITSEHAYPLKLEALLRARYTLQSPRVVPEGIPAEYAVDGVNRLPQVLAQYKPDILILMEGTNDLIFQQAGVEEGSAAIRTMVQQAKAFNVKVLLSTIIPQRAGGQRSRDIFAAFVPVMNARIKQIAAAEGVPLVDMFAVFEKDMTLIGTDDLHPTPRGFDVMAQTFFDAIKQHFEQPHPTTGLQR